jgi:biotin transporter BioY
MHENMERPATEDGFKGIESQLSQIKTLLGVLLIASLGGLYFLARLADAMDIFFLIVMALAIWGVLVQCIAALAARRTGQRRIRQLERDGLAKALTDRQPRDDGTPA